MGVAITLCYETEHERRENKRDDSFFPRSETESLSCLIKFGAPAFLQLVLSVATALFHWRTRDALNSSGIVRTLMI